MKHIEQGTIPSIELINILIIIGVTAIAVTAVGLKLGQFLIQISLAEYC